MLSQEDFRRVVIAGKHNKYLFYISGLNDIIDYPVSAGCEVLPQAPSLFHFVEHFPACLGGSG
jgi:hypothetical protein